MKKLILFLFCAGLAAPAAAQVKFTTQPTDLVYEAAMIQHKLVFIDLYAEWCPPCRAMEKQVFSRSDVGDFMNKHFIAAKYNIDEYTGKKLMEKYGFDAIPTYLIFNTEAELLGSIQGASGPEQFLQDVQKIISGKLPK